MKFIVDSMLGKLAKRLRLLGQDTIYTPDIDDHDLIKISKLEGRVIVTRDTGVAKVRGLKVLLIRSTALEEQLKEFSRLSGIRFDSRTSFSRCPDCNTPVEEAEKEKIKSIVPKLVYDTMDKFAYCPNCNKAYWQGSHYEKLVKELKSM
jgi:uncharacterized protein with PIN domain